MEREENLGRCEVCGFISQQSNVQRHMNQVHGVQENDDYELIEYELEDSQNDFEEDQQQLYWNQNDEEDDKVVLDEETVELTQMKKNDELHEKLHWSKSQVKLLLQLYKTNKVKFEDKKTRNKTVWKVISNKLSEISKCKITPEQCENKFKNLKKTYKQIKDNNKSSGRGAKNWDLFPDMDLIFSKDPDVNPISTCSNLEGSFKYVDQEESASISNENESTSKENASNSKENVPTNIRGQKRKKPGEEPEWFKKFREDCQKRHEEKMHKQDRLLTILEKFADK